MSVVQPPQQMSPSPTIAQASSTNQERVLITGDDILIEYVDRLM